MAYQPNPNGPHRAGRSEEEMRRRDNELQADPQLAEGPASGSKVAMYVIAIAVVLGAVFYGLNNTTMNQAGTTPPSFFEGHGHAPIAARQHAFEKAAIDIVLLHLHGAIPAIAA